MAKGSGKGSGKKSAGVGQAVKAVAAAAAPVAAMAGGVAGPGGGTAQFDADLKRVSNDVGRRYLGGLAEIADLRDRFQAAGWSRAQFDKAILDAELRNVISLRTIDDPLRAGRTATDGVRAPRRAETAAGGGKSDHVFGWLLVR